MATPVVQTTVRRAVRASAVAVLGPLLVLAACGDDADPEVVAGDPGELALPRCDTVPELGTAPDVATLSADPEVAAWQQARAEAGMASDEAATLAAAGAPATEAVEPVEAMGFPMTQAEADAFFHHQARNGALADRVRRFAEDQPWFGGLWLDNVAYAVGVGVVGDVDARQAEFDAEFGPGTVLATEAAHTVDELAGIQEAVTAWLEDRGVRSGGSGSGNRQNVVTVFLEVLDVSVVADLAASVGADGICVEGAEPDEVVPEGPQPQEGAGWRLLADEPGAGVPYATGFAGDQAAYEALWAQIGLRGDPPAVDFAAEIVAWFGPAVSGSCPEIRMDDVVFDAETATLRPVIVLVGGSRSCTDDANPHAYVVAFDRAGLPERFTVSIEPPNPECCPEGTTQVDLGD